MAISLWRVCLFILLGLLVERFVRLVYALGLHRHVYTHHPGPCRSRRGTVDGSEDIVTSSNGLAFISSGFLKMADLNADVRGKIFVFDFNKPNDAPREVKIESDVINASTWLPLGIDLWESGSKDKPKLTLFVINRYPGQSAAVDVFDFQSIKGIPTLKHMKRIQHKNIRRPNDLVVLDENRFFATNDGYLPPPYDQIELLLTLSAGNVIFYDGAEVTVVADRVKLANGINMSPDKKFLYVSACSGLSVNIYKINSDMSLTLAKSIKLETMPDNIDVDKTNGDLWIGTNKLAYTFLQSGGKYNGVGQVLRIQLDSDLNPTIREVLADDTGLLRGSSVANRHGNAMLVGTVVDKAAYCDLLAY